MCIEAKCLRFVAAVLMTAQLAACGGGDSGGGGSGGGAPAMTLTGVAALGAPLSGATVTASDANGTTRQASAATGADGSYGIDVTGLTAPILVQVAGEFAGEPVVLHSVQGSTPSANPKVNVTPLTDAIVAKLYGTNPAEVFQSSSRPAKTLADVTDAANDVSTALAPVMTAAGIADPSASNLISTSFSADGTGIDRVLDNLSVTKDDSTITVDGSGNPAGGAIVIANRSDPSSGVSIDLAAGTVSGTLPTTLVSIDPGLAALASSLTAAYQNGCDATALAAVLDANYLHNGTTFADMTSGGICTRWANATFSRPTVQPLPIGAGGTPLSPPAGAQPLRFSVKAASGATELFVTRAQQQPDGSWKLVGNGSKYRVQVFPTAFKFVQPAATITADVPAGLSPNGLHVKYVNGLAVQTIGGFVFTVFGSGKDNAGPATPVKSAKIEVYKQGAWQPISHRSKPATYTTIGGSSFDGQPTQDNLNDGGCPGGWLGFGHPDRGNCSNKLFVNDLTIQNMPSTGVSFRITLYDAKEATGNVLDTRYVLVPSKPAPSTTIGALPMPKLCAAPSATCVLDALAGIDGFNPYTPSWVNFNPSVSVRSVVAYAFDSSFVGNQAVNNAVPLGASSATLSAWKVGATGAAATAPVAVANRALILNSTNATNGMRYASFVNSWASDAPLNDSIGW